MSSSKIEFYLSCKGLRRADVLSKSDPVAVASLGEADHRGKIQYIEIGRTERIDNTDDPEWTHQFVVDYYFNKAQYIKVKVYDDDTISSDDGLGRVDFSLGKLMSSPGGTLKERLRKKSGRETEGKIIIRAEEMSHCADRCRLTLRGIQLPNKDHFFGKSDPYFTISRVREDGKWQQVLKSETVTNDLDPKWKPQSVSVQALCNGDYVRPLRLEVWDWDRDGDHDSMGGIETNLKSLLESQGREMDLQSVKKHHRKNGRIKVDHAEIFKAPTLLDFLAGGLQINLSVAIDFTASNGHPREPRSLHHIDPSGRLNQYQQAIWSIGSILQEYDHDRMFPVYGFGGVVSGNTVSHCFPIRRTHAYGPNDSDEAYGVDGILAAYTTTLNQVTLSGPTLFSEVLDTAIARTRRPEGERGQHYDVLLILTDGIINDMRQTIDCLVAASDVPLSVVIVGVGRADFTDMSILDGDGRRLQDSARRTASRDVVQFVPFSKYTDAPGEGARLAKDTMAEIPGQLLQYFSMRGIRPHPPRSAPHPHSPVPSGAPYGAGGYNASAPRSPVSSGAPYGAGGYNAPHPHSPVPSGEPYGAGGYNASAPRSPVPSGAPYGAGGYNAPHPHSPVPSGSYDRPPPYAP